MNNYRTIRPGDFISYLKDRMKKEKHNIFWMIVYWRKKWNFDEGIEPARIVQWIKDHTRKLQFIHKSRFDRTKFVIFEQLNYDTRWKWHTVSAT